MYTLREDTFKYSTLLFLSLPTKSEIKKLLDKGKYIYEPENLDLLFKQIIELDTAHAATFFIKDTNISVIVFYQWDNNAGDYGALAHEIFHVVDYNLSFRDIKLSNDSDEVYAYHIEFFMRNFLNMMWK